LRALEGRGEVEDIKCRGEEMKSRKEWEKKYSTSYREKAREG